MRALVFDGDLNLIERPPPVAGPGEARIRVRRAGICATDLEIISGYMGYEGVLGHEFVGEVVSADDTSLVGTRVVGEINAACGVCDWCGRGLGRHCPARTVLGILGRAGCFAEEICLPTQNLHRVPDALTDDAAVFTEPLAAAFEIVEQGALQGCDEALVLGDGRLGLLCAMVIASTGVKTTVVGKHPRKLAIAERAGIDAMLTADLGDRRYRVVVEATGSPSGLAHALELLKPRGTLVLKSTYAGRPEVDMARVVIDELTILGSRCGPFDRALAAMRSGDIDPSALIDADYPFSRALDAIEHAGRPGTLKVTMTMPE